MRGTILHQFPEVQSTKEHRVIDQTRLPPARCLLGNPFRRLNVC